MRKFVKVFSLVLAFSLLAACGNEKKEMKIDDGVVLQSISKVDPTYSWNNYKKLNNPTVKEFKNNKNLAVKITGNYMVLVPDSVESYVNILFPEELIYPNIDSKKYNTDSDGHLYLDPGEFTVIEKDSEYNDMKIKFVLANTKDDVQDIEKCEIIYMDLVPTVYSKLKIPELDMTLTDDVTDHYAFFKKADLISETDTDKILQYSMIDSGVLFIFNKEDDSFKSMRIFSSNNLEGYRYNSLLR